LQQRWENVWACAVIRRRHAIPCPQRLNGRIRDMSAGPLQGTRVVEIAGLEPEHGVYGART